MQPRYKKMIRGMKEKQKGPTGVLAARRRSRKAADERWFLYILRCIDGSFYTGITKDIERRFKMHESGKASRYTRTRRPVTLLYQEKCLSRTQALIRECEIKEWPRRKKEELVNPSLSQQRSHRRR